MGVGAKDVSRGMNVPFSCDPIQNGLPICNAGLYGRRNRKLPYLQTVAPVPSATLVPSTQHNRQADCYSQQCISQPVYAACGMVLYARTVVQFPYHETCRLIYGTRDVSEIYQSKIHRLLGHLQIIRGV